MNAQAAFTCCNVRQEAEYYERPCVLGHTETYSLHYTGSRHIRPKSCLTLYEEEAGGSTGALMCCEANERSSTINVLVLIIAKGR